VNNFTRVNSIASKVDTNSKVGSTSLLELDLTFDLWLITPLLFSRNDMVAST